MKKSLKRCIAFLLAVLIAFSCMAVATVAVDDEEETTASQYDESHSFWQIFVDAVKSWWSMIRYIFYDVLLGKNPGTIPDAPTKQPVTYTTDA